MSNKGLSRNKASPSHQAENHAACVYDLRFLNRLRPLQCGEAYYSVCATNNLECDKPIQAYK